MSVTIAVGLTVIDFEATKRCGCLESDGTDGAWVLPGEVNDLLNLVTVESVIERDGQCRGQLDAFESGDGLLADIPEIFTTKFDDISRACAVELEVDGGEAPFDKLFGEVRFAGKADAIADHFQLSKAFAFNHSGYFVQVLAHRRLTARDLQR